MKIKEIRDKDDAALTKDLVERQRHLFDLRSQGVTEKQDDTTQRAKTRRDVARIKTVLHQRKLAGPTTK